VTISSDAEPLAATVVVPIHTRRRAYLADAALVGVTLVWGSTFVVVKTALGGASPFEFVALRFAIAFIALAVIFYRRIFRLSGAELRAGALIGVFLFLGYGFQTLGLQFSTAARAGFVTGLSVLIVPPFAYLALRHRVGRGVVAGIALAAVGMYLLSFDGPITVGVGDVLVFCCAVAFAAHIVSISVYAPRFDPIRLAIVQTGFVAVLASVVAVVSERPLGAPSSAAWIAAGYTGIVGTAAVLGVQTSVQRFTSPAHAALIFSLEPVFAALFAYIVVGETLGPAGWLGGALILGGMLVAELRR
jgi:drug/metabolite transporter (DMT)-like permease